MTPIVEESNCQIDHESEALMETALSNGECPSCGGHQFFLGPSGGLSQNLLCTSCFGGYNWSRGFFAERIPSQNMIEMLKDPQILVQHVAKTIDLRTVVGSRNKVQTQWGSKYSILTWFVASGVTGLIAGLIFVSVAQHIHVTNTLEGAKITWQK